MLRARWGVPTKATGHSENQREEIDEIQTPRKRRAKGEISVTDPGLEPSGVRM